MQGHTPHVYEFVGTSHSSYPMCPSFHPNTTQQAYTSYPSPVVSDSYHVSSPRYSPTGYQPNTNTSKPQWNPTSFWYPPRSTSSSTPSVRYCSDYYDEDQNYQYQQYLDRQQRKQEVVERIPSPEELFIEPLPKTNQFSSPSPYNNTPHQSTEPVRETRVLTSSHSSIGADLINAQFGEFVLGQLGVPESRPEQSHLSDKDYRDITEYLGLPQTQAAKLIGIPTSTLSKRWKQAYPQRKWPWRTVNKLDKLIAKVFEENEGTTPLSPHQETKLALLRRQRADVLKPASIRL